MSDDRYTRTLPPAPAYAFGDVRVYGADGRLKRVIPAATLRERAAESWESSSDSVADSSPSADSSSSSDPT